MSATSARWRRYETAADFVRNECAYLDDGRCATYGAGCRVLGETVKRCDWLEDRALLRAPPAVLDDYLSRVGEAPSQDDMTYTRRVADLVGVLGDIAPGWIEPSSRPAGDIARRRVAKLLVEAWLKVPHGVDDVQKVVNRALFLEEEVYRRTQGVRFTVEALPQEIKHPREATRFTRINAGVWDEARHGHTAERRCLSRSS